MDMREHLGWVTNCDDEQGCPQNWMEIPASDLPAKVRCHRCDREVELHATAESFRQAASNADSVSAFPVVPCAGLPASYELDADPSAGPVRATRGASPRSAPPAKPKPAPRPKTMVLILPNGEEYPLDKQTHILGRSRTCDVVIASAKVSRQHASVVNLDGKFFIEDLGSANGVWKDGERINGRAELQHGDAVTICDEQIDFELR